MIESCSKSQRLSGTCGDSTIMFPQSAEAFLDMECMAIGGTLLAGTLARHLHRSS